MQEFKNLMPNQQKSQNFVIKHNTSQIPKKYLQTDQIIYSITDLQHAITGNVQNPQFLRNPATSMTLIQTPALNTKKISYLEQVDQGIKSISKVIAWTNPNDDEDSNSFGLNQVSEYGSQSSEAISGRLLDFEQRLILDSQIQYQQKSMEPRNKINGSSGNLQKNQERKIDDQLKSGNQSKKGCNCKKTQCLKLYCDCFRDNKKCEGCACVGCHNTEQYNQQRSNAMVILIDRDPEAFKPKIQSQTHTKGCNCKKSNCQKKYCECYQAGLQCGQMCKCIECKNCQVSFKKKKINKIKIDIPFDFKVKSKNGPTIIVPAQTNQDKNRLKIKSK